MSWSASLPEAKPLDEIKAEAFNFTPQTGLEDESREQFDVAVDAARDIIGSGAIGSEKKFTVSLSGHANEDHEPAEGWSNDMVSISVYQADAA